MNIKVDDNIIEQTTKCRKNFSCLSGETQFVALNSVLKIKYILLNVSSNERMRSCIRILIKNGMIILSQISSDIQCKDKDTAEEQLINRLWNRSNGLLN